jgi:small-conductance mechanosensitive channel
VLSIGWRSTLLGTLQNNTVVVPNSTLGKAVIINYSTPNDRLFISIPVRVAYGTDSRRVEKILTEIAREAAREESLGLMAQPEPVAQLNPGFGPSTLDFTLTVQVRHFQDQGAVQSELRKRVLERFEKEEIQMPFPTQRVLLDESAVDGAGRSNEH